MTVNELPVHITPWSELGQRWGHPWHTMSSYLGAFPAALARSMIALLSEPGDVVLDPFCGRGTTLLEARLLGRVALAGDLNPIAAALTLAKNVTVTLAEVIARVDELEARYDPLLFVPEAQVESDDIQLIFHPRTLGQLCFLRRYVILSARDVDRFLVGAVLGIMHGSERQDGSSSYASISMPNTFSMSPDYVRRYVETKRLQRVERNVFALLRAKVHRLFREEALFQTKGFVARADAKRISEIEPFGRFRGKVRLVVTSPPYLDVVNYAKQNWIRTWFLDEHHDSVSEGLDDNLTLKGWLDFADEVMSQMHTMLQNGGVVAFVVGDVARPKRGTISLAREFIRHALHNHRFSYVGCLSDRIQTEIKTTRIWGDTKGQATAIDRIVFLSDRAPEFHTERLDVDLFGVNLASVSDLDAERLRQYALSFVS